MRAYSEIEGEQIVRLARAAIELSIRSPHIDMDMLTSPLSRYGASDGAFVTLYHYPAGGIRNRVGVQKAGARIADLVVNAALGVAFKDPKAVPVSIGEFGHLVVTVDIISDMEEIKAEGRARLMKMKIGRDGIYIKYGIKSVLLLPSFPEENRLSKESFFQAACRMIGLDGDFWMQPKVKVCRFETQAFAEEEPDGRVRRVSKPK